MASIRSLKKDILFSFGSILDAVFYCSQISKVDNQKAEALLEEVTQTYEKYLSLTNAKVENKKQHFKQLNQDLTKDITALVEKINSL